jgi:hypothetical protein
MDMNEKVTIVISMRLVNLIVKLFRMADPMGLFLQEEVNNILKQIQNVTEDNKE